MADDAREKNLALLLDQVEKRVSFEIESRKFSETRALAIITLNVAIVTLFFALRTQLGIWTQPAWDCSRFILLASSLSQLISIAVAVVAVIPARVSLLQAPAFEVLRGGAQVEAESMADEMLEARIAELAGLSEVSNRKASLTLAAILVFAVAVSLFILAVVATLI